MSAIETAALIEEICSIFQEIDQDIQGFQEGTKLSCPTECGICCETQEIEATVLEALPLASAIFERGEAETVLDSVEALLSREDYSCVLFRPDPDHPEKGRCGYYSVRPLICRLFGFAARRNRLDVLELCTCKHISSASPDVVRHAQTCVSEGIRIPVFQNSFMRIAALNPSIGFARRPINLAIREAVEYLYWRRPERHASSPIPSEEAS